MPRVLLVEDDTALATALHLALRRLGHDVTTNPSGETALRTLLDDHVLPDVVILDLMLPGIDGFEVCRRVRAALPVPIILLTARGDAIDVVAGLECGADDYVVKPVEPRVLDARVKAVLRRATPISAQETVVRIGPLEFDRTAMVATRHGRELNLSATETRLLVEFVQHAGQVLSRQSLLKRVWDYGYVGDSRLVDAAVARLRAKIEDDPANPTLLKTVRGLGYRLAKP
ncbi:response regulator transcription factor [Saccharomonospora xinjiangensis]|uniref:Response regulator with CheY-like receiver domain and winged-helix DNA-binding domain n=1 Tax=Saccharomonospora xinjiangensis XJ-54 TaxID=882086 RepID=I0UZT8_9PSEU|nr:response regulator transcription factor [Saccharomonospora xinjiangensis]EID53391.1 response regulator with CheY-like receiver domain and winged-helix DNA-binding domain [Saccharomonospora xinjiangensis XJ-54]